MDLGMPSLIEREQLLQKVPPHPEHLPLSVLISTVKKLYLCYQGLSEREFFVRAYGDTETARREYSRACRKGAEDLCVRNFAIKRIERLKREILEEAASAL